MISPSIAKIIEIFPERFIRFCSRKIVDKYLNKYADIKVKGIDNLKFPKRPVIFICNHLSNSDGLVINKVLEKEDLTFIAGIKLSQNATTKLGTYIVKTIPIKPNSADKDGISKTVKALKNGNSICIFPEGTRSRKGKMIEAKRGIILIAKLARVPIVPLGIWGTEKLLPINEQGEMSSEQFNYAKVHLNIGESITLPKKEKEEGKKEYEERAVRYLMGSVAKLLPTEYRGYYE